MTAEKPPGEESPELRALLRAAGIGVASFSADGELTAANDVFRDIASRAPGAAQAMCLRALQERKPVESLRFERRLGWMRWTAHPVSDGVAIQVAKATEEDLRVERLAKQVSEVAGLPTRAALNVELEVTWSDHARHALMLIEPQAPPRELALPIEQAERAIAFVAVVLSARLLDGEGVFGLSPLTLAILSNGRHPQDRMAYLLAIANEALMQDETWREMPLIAGCAARAGAASPGELYRHASLALLDQRVSPTTGTSWYPTGVGGA